MQRSNKSFVFVLAAALLASGLSGPADIRAADPTPAPDASPIPGAGLKITPTVYEETIEPGKTKDGVIDVFNISSTPLTVTTTIENIRMHGENGDLEYYIGDNPYRLHALVQLDRTPFTLQPGEARRVKFRVAIPIGLYPGGYFASIFFQIIPGSPSETESSIGQSGRVGTLLLFTVAGDVDQKGTVEKLSITENRFTSSKSFEILYANTGSTTTKPLGVAYEPTGSLEIKNMLGLPVRKQSVQGETVFPGAKRKMGAQFKKPFWFGRYTVEANVSPGNGKPAETKRLAFWAVSPLAVAILAGAAVLGLLLITRRRFFRGGTKLDVSDTQSVSLMDEAAKADRRPTDGDPNKRSDD